MQQIVRTKQQQLTKQESLIICKELIHDTFSCVSYLRGLFPEEAFQKHAVHGVESQRLKRGVSPAVDALLDWIECGCYDALERGYLRQIELGIYLDAEAPLDLVEQYTFDVEYGQQGDVHLLQHSYNTNTPNSSTKATVVNSLKQTMRNIFMLTQTLDPLPDGRYLTMRLHYFDDLTPVDYQPPLFRAGTDVATKVVGHDVQKWKLGGIASGYHQLQIKMTTAVGGCNNSQASPRGDNDKEPRHQPEFDRIVLPSQLIADADKQQTGEEKFKSQIVDLVVNCCCGDDQADQPEDMVQCGSCKKWQHPLCAGFEYEQQFKSDDQLASWYECHCCQIAKCGQLEVDAELLTDICRYRRMLGVLWRDGYTTLKALQDKLNVTYNVARRVKNILLGDGFLRLNDQNRLELVKNAKMVATKANVYNDQLLLQKIGAVPEPNNNSSVVSTNEQQPQYVHSDIQETNQVAVQEQKLNTAAEEEVKCESQIEEQVDQSGPTIEHNPEVSNFEFQHQLDKHTYKQKKYRKRNKSRSSVSRSTLQV